MNMYAARSGLSSRRRGKTIMRLTNKETKIKLSDTKRYDLQDHKMFTKLSELEDIEEKVGISLIIIFKALKNGIWVKREDKIEKIEITTNLRLVLDCNGSTDKMSYWILDYQDITRGNDRIECIDNWFVDKYGVEWALTKEELEK